MIMPAAAAAAAAEETEEDEEVPEVVCTVPVKEPLPMEVMVRLEGAWMKVLAAATLPFMGPPVAIRVGMGDCCTI